MADPAEKAIRDWLAARFPAARVVTETPSDLAEVLPCIKVNRIGGNSTIPTIDNAHVDVEYFGSTRDEARGGAESVRRAFETELPGVTVGGNVVLAVTEIQSPTWAPYDNTNVRRFDATYRISLHTD